MMGKSNFGLNKVQSMENLWPKIGMYAEIWALFRPTKGLTEKINNVIELI